MSDTSDKGIGWMRAGLESIIARAKQRREQEQAQEQPERVELFTAGAPEPVEQEPAPVAEPEPDFTDTTVWLEQRRPEWQWFDGFPVLTNRYTVSYRKRTAEDEGKSIEHLPPLLPKPIEPEKVEWSNLQRTPAAFHGDAQGRMVIGGPQRDEGPRRAIPDRDGRHHPIRQGVRYDVKTGDPI
jgi:hypothetical protein